MAIYKGLHNMHESFGSHRMHGLRRCLEQMLVKGFLSVRDMERCRYSQLLKVISRSFHCFLVPPALFPNVRPCSRGN